MSKKDITLTVNGDVYDIKAEASASLADVLRDTLGMTGTKTMCNAGECGSCTVIIDKQAVLACMTLAVDAQGRDIQTIEGVADTDTGDLHPIQEAFVELSGMQCGVCTPGMIMASKAFLDENQNPGEEEIKDALGGNLCRCGNYPRINQAVQLAAQKIMDSKK